MRYNVCRFLPNRKNSGSLNIINLVYETQCETDPEKNSIATYRMYYVTDGKGRLHTDGGTEELKKGDVYIAPPAIPFAIENTENIKFIYISYLGVRANALAEQFKIGRFGERYTAFDALQPVWESLFYLPDEVVDIRCEGVLLYTFAEIGKKIFAPHKEKPLTSVVGRIKKYVDENFTDCELTVELIAARLSYHPKYISAAFKKEFNICLSEYIKILRIQNACTLMEQGITSIKDIALHCGYSDPLYFSTVFKKQMGISPKDHIKELNSARQP